MYTDLPQWKIGKSGGCLNFLPRFFISILSVLGVEVLAISSRDIQSAGSSYIGVFTKGSFCLFDTRTTDLGQFDPYNFCLGISLKFQSELNEIL